MLFKSRSKDRNLIFTLRNNEGFFYFDIIKYRNNETDSYSDKAEGL